MSLLLCYDIGGQVFVGAISWVHNHAQYLQMRISGRQNRGRAAVEVQLCDYKNQTLEAFMRQVVCMTSLIVQWLGRICHFWLLRMIVKRAYVY